MFPNARKLCLLLILAALIAAAWTSGFNSADGWCEETVDFFAPGGVWSLLPPIIAIALAFMTKNVVVSLLVGVFSGAFLIALQSQSPGMAVLDSFTLSSQFMRNSVANPWNAGILLQCGAIGGLIALMTGSGGVRAVADRISRYARGPVSSQIVTWILGLFIFFDDYANVQIVGPVMRPITDKNKVSREKLAFLLDSTAAPIAGIALISTWIGTELSYIKEGFDAAGIDNIAPYSLFVSTIPYRFYNILMLFMVLLTAVMLREFGVMRKAEILARKGWIRELDSRLIRLEDAQREEFADSRNDLQTDSLSVEDESEVEGLQKMERLQKTKSEPFSAMFFALIPLAVLVVTAFVSFYFSGRAKILDGENVDLITMMSRPFAFDTIRECFSASDASIAIFRAALLAGIVAFAMCVVSKKMKASEAVGLWINGVKSLVFTFVILILAWSLASCIGRDGLGTAKFLVGTFSTSVPVFLLPTLIFVLGAVISFATGTSYGTMAILMPLAIPFAHELMPGDYSYLVAVSSAVLTGAIFGDHCSPISDTTILSSMGARCGLMEHVNTQLPYALWVAVLSILFGFLPVGLGFSVTFVLPLSLLSVFVLLLIFGRKVPANVLPESPSGLRTDVDEMKGESS